MSGMAKRSFSPGSRRDVCDNCGRHRSLHHDGVMQHCDPADRAADEREWRRTWGLQ